MKVNCKTIVTIELENEEITFFKRIWIDCVDFDDIDKEKFKEMIKFQKELGHEFI